MYLPIARKYRPSNFSEVIGQDVSVRIMQNSILMNREIKTMLISGIRGTGKTTLARIYAKALNCVNFANNKDLCGECVSCLEPNHPDIFEFDAASNNGVDFIRELENLIGQVPSYGRRIIIFDEAHMFTTQAQNALLKTLEDTPGTLTIILVTTDPEKLETTIRSRCLSMPLKALTQGEVRQSIQHVLNAEGKAYEEGFVDTLSLVGGGSLRDVQQVLDQCIMAAGDEELKVQYLQESAGIVSVTQYRKLAAILNGLDLRTGMDALNDWYVEGYDLEQLFIDGIPNLLRDFSFILNDVSLPLCTGLSRDLVKSKLTLSMEYVKFIELAWEQFYSMVRETSRPKLVWELFFVNIFPTNDSIVDLGDY